MSETKVIRVLLVDDHALVREGLSLMIGTQPDMTVVAEAINGQHAVEQFRRYQPDLTLMDLRLPVMSGVDATIAIRQEFHEARLIVLTTYDGDEDIYRALQAGAMAYLLKDVPGEQLLEAMRAVHAGHRYMPPVVANKLSERMFKSELTPRELEVLNLIMKGMSNKEIARTTSITEETVKSHVSNILSKLGVSDRTQAVIIALQRGIFHLD